MSEGIQYRFGDVVEWDVPTGQIRWLIVEGRPGDYRGVWLSGGGAMHEADMKRGWIKEIGAGHPNHCASERVRED